MSCLHLKYCKAKKKKNISIVTTPSLFINIYCCFRIKVCGPDKNTNTTPIKSDNLDTFFLNYAFARYIFKNIACFKNLTKTNDIAV